MLLGVFLVGVVTTICSIIRILSMNHLDLSTNLTGTMVYADFLSCFEVNLGILCVSLPTLGPVYHRFFKRAGLSTSYGTGQKTPGSTSNGLRTFGGSGIPRKHYRLDDTAGGSAEQVYGCATTKCEAREASPTGSDIELNPIQPQGLGNEIQVQTQWTVQVSSK